MRERAPATIERRMLLPCALIAVFFTPVAMLSPLGGGDTWWYLAVGRSIAAEGVPDVDVLSFTVAGSRWINPEWLSNLLFFRLFDAFGSESLVAFKGVLVCCTLLLVALRASVRATKEEESQVDSGIVAPFAAVLVATVVCRTFLDIRAQLFTFFFANLALLAVELSRKKDGPIFLLPLLALPWVNLHGGFLFLYVLLFCLLVDALLPDATHRKAGILVAVAGCVFLVSLVNPYGLDMYGFLAETLVREKSGSILEWFSPLHLDVAGLSTPLYWAYAALLAMLSFASRECLSRDELFVAIATFVMSLSARRFIPLFVLSTAPMCARILARRISALAVSRRSAVAVAATGFLAITSADVAMLAGVASRGSPFEYLVGIDEFPVRACVFARTLETRDLRIYNHYEWGGYLLWMLPDARVFIDGRGHTLYDRAFFRRYEEMRVCAPACVEPLRRETDSSGANAAMLDARTEAPLAEMFFSLPEWRLVFADGRALFFLRDAVR